jgi:hypothetical protein
VCAAVDAAVAAGIVVVIAAGNEGPNANTLMCPATSRTGLWVGALYPGDQKAWWDALKPWQRRAREVLGLQFGEAGTSFAAAFASGVCALLLSACPRVTGSQVTDALVDNDSGRALADAALKRLAETSGCDLTSLSEPLDEGEQPPFYRMARAYVRAKTGLREWAEAASSPSAPNFLASVDGHAWDLDDAVRTVMRFLEFWVIEQTGDSATAKRELEEIQGFFGAYPRSEIADVLAATL